MTTTKKYIGLSKLWHYARIGTLVSLFNFKEVLTFKMSLKEYVIYQYRLLRLFQTVFPNKLISFNNKYRMQLYFPSYPSPAFFHAIKKFDPRNKECGALTVVFSMTKACGYRCPHCYQREDKGGDLDVTLLKNVAKEMTQMGTAMFDIEGGEPLLRFDRLLELLHSFDNRAELWVNTTGATLTEEMVVKLKNANLYGVMVSLHSHDKGKYEEFVGIEGAFEVACNAIKLFQKHGIMTAINFCPSKVDVQTGAVEKLIEKARELEVSMVQVIHAKNAGAWLSDQANIYNEKSMIDDLKKLHDKYNTSGQAESYPSILFQVFEESPEAFGCTAGGIDRYYLNHEGEVQPCEFLNVSFGNVQDEPFKVIFKRMREHFKTPGVNWLCTKESSSIAECIKSNGLVKTPIPWPLTKDVVLKWKMGTPTKIYKDIKIYDSKK